MINTEYLIEYNLTTTLEGHSEFSNDQIIEKRSMISVSNDLNEIFTDLFDKHRFDSIVAIEILGVKNLEENLSIKENLSVYEYRK